MPKAEDIKVLNIDEVPYAVDSMSETVQQMVAVFNEWNQKEADAQDAFMLVRAAKNDLSRQIINQVRTEKEEAEKEEAEKEDGDVASDGPSVAPVE